jgi:outer membrane biosynthesis protein TonB
VSDYRRRRRSEPPGKWAFGASVSVHVAAILLVWWSTTLGAEVPQFVIYEIELVSPAALEFGELTPPALPDLVVETPRQAEPVEQNDPVVVEDALPLRDEPVEEQPEEEAAPPPPEAEATEQPTSPTPDPEAAEGGEDIDVRMEGLQRDYPEYYNNIIRQIDRCFRWQGSSDLRVTVRFVINRDGTVSDQDIVEGSGSFSFDIDALGAIECAGSRNRLGPLPKDFRADRLDVVFKFDPARRGGLDELLERLPE